MKSIISTIKESEFFVIAEIALNHDGSLGNAIRLIEEAKTSGANAVKFQLHISKEENLKTISTPPYFKIEDRNEYFDRTSFSINEWKKLKNFAHENNLYFLVSPFSHKAVNMLEEIEIDAYKIASGETSNLPLLEFITSKKKPILLSTGMSNWAEISKAVDILKDNLIVIFQCSSQYPCKPENTGINIIEELKKRYKGMTIGYSDHTLNNYTSIAALMKGVTVFEKHFTLSKNLYGPDNAISLEPKEMLDYVKGLDFISKVLKNPVDKNDLNLYIKVKENYEKSIVASRDLLKDSILEFNDLDFKKPGNGIRADKYKELIGKRLKRDLKRDEQISFNDIKLN